MIKKQTCGFYYSFYIFCRKGTLLALVLGLSVFTSYPWDIKRTGLRGRGWGWWAALGGSLPQHPWRQTCAHSACGRLQREPPAPPPQPRGVAVGAEILREWLHEQLWMTDRDLVRGHPSCHPHGQSIRGSSPSSLGFHRFQSSFPPFLQKDWNFPPMWWWAWGKVWFRKWRNMVSLVFMCEEPKWSQLSCLTYCHIYSFCLFVFYCC